MNVTWADIHRNVSVLAEKIQAEAPCARAIDLIGILRGGVVVTTLLSHVLESRGIQSRVYGVGIRSYKGRELGVGDVYQMLQGYFGNPIFVIDDVVTTGRTLARVQSELSENCEFEEELLTCVLYSNGEGKADYVAERVNEWVVFPWEIVLVAPDGENNKGMEYIGLEVKG